MCATIYGERSSPTIPHLIKRKGKAKERQGKERQGGKKPPLETLDLRGCFWGGNSNLTLVLTGTRDSFWLIRYSYRPLLLDNNLLSWALRQMSSEYLSGYYRDLATGSLYWTDEAPKHLMNTVTAKSTSTSIKRIKQFISHCAYVRWMSIWWLIPISF